MSWHTNGPGTSKTRRSGAHPVHTVTGATSTREHQRIKREQAEARNAVTPPERRRVNRRLVDELETSLVSPSSDLTPASI